MGQALSGGGCPAVRLELWPVILDFVFSNLAPKPASLQTRRRRSMTSRARAHTSLPGQLGKDGALQLQHASLFFHSPETHAFPQQPRERGALMSHALERETRPSTALAAEETTRGESSWIQVGWAGPNSLHPGIYIHPVFVFLLGEDSIAQGGASRSSKDTGRSRKCGYCSSKLSTDYSKPFCAKCIVKLAGKETSEILRGFLEVQSEMLSTLKEFHGSLKSKEPEPPIAGPSSQESSASQFVRFRQESLGSLISDSEDSEMPPLEAGSVDQAEEEGEDARSGRYVFAADEMGSLLEAVYASEEIPQSAEQVTSQDRLYQGLVKAQSKAIPVHQSLKDIILREWADPEKKILKYKTWKRRCPFKEEEESKFFKIPRLDAPLAQVSKQSDLSFEDAGNLKDPMDRRAETSLRRAWEANAAALSPALASACIARNANSWTSTLMDLVTQVTDSKDILESIQLIGSAVAYLADAAVETVRSSAKTGALLNSARRAVWVKMWNGDLASKNRLCGLPFEGSLLFGTGLDQALTRSSEKGVRFPTKPRQNRKKFFRGSQGGFAGKTRPSDKRPPNNRRWGVAKDKPKGGVLFSNTKPSDKDSK